MTLSVNPTEVFINGDGVADLGEQASVTVSGGTGSYSYSWQFTGGNASIYAMSPSSNATAFGGGSVGQSATFICQVSDGVATVDSATVTVIVDDGGGF